MKKQVQMLLVAVALAVLSGCATLPSPETMKAETAGYQLPKQPEAGKAIVYVVRPATYGGLIRFNVFLGDQEDASEMGFTRGGQYVHFNVRPGAHKIFSKAENWAEVNVDLKAGEVAFIQQEPSMGIIMARNNLFKLEDYHGKYLVKTLTVGTILKSDK
jgi:hypothetical protein